MVDVDVARAIDPEAFRFWPIEADNPGKSIVDNSQRQRQEKALLAANWVLELLWNKAKPVESEGEIDALRAELDAARARIEELEAADRLEWRPIRDLRPDVDVLVRRRGYHSWMDDFVWDYAVLNAGQADDYEEGAYLAWSVPPEAAP